jgi:DNA-binding CsgD family transcriptional regulator
MFELSPRQTQIADLVAEGLREQEIAARLGISRHTVRNHKQTIFHKLGARNVVELANIWLGRAA